MSVVFSGQLRRPMALRRFLFLLAWAIVISSLFVTNFRGELLSGPRNFPGFMKIAYDIVGFVFASSDASCRTFNQIRFICNNLFFASQCIADLYFFFTIAVIAIPPSLRVYWLPIGKIFRYPSIVLLFIWLCPLYSFYFPSPGSTWEDWKWGYYWMASGYTLMMICILYNPRIPSSNTSFPVTYDPQKNTE